MVVAILQARCSSNRLPRKVLQIVCDKPMIIHELIRLKRSRRIDQIVLATSTDKSDDELVEIAKQYVEVYRGSLEDVLDRYYQCAKELACDTVVRITGDCPVIDWNIVDEVIEQHSIEGNDYTALTEKYPDGLDTEVFSFLALKRSWEEAVLPSEREHVTQYIRKNPIFFKLGFHDWEKDLSYMRWTVDEPKDLLTIREIYKHLYKEKPDFLTTDILNLLERHSEIPIINSDIKRNEGLLKSLQEDKKWLRDNQKEK